MDIAVSSGAGVPVLTLGGRFDGTAAAVFDREAAALESEAVHWAVDFSQVTYLSSLGIRSVMALEQRLKARGGGLVLADLSPMVRRVLHVSRLEGFLTIVPTLADAIEVARTSASMSPAAELTIGPCRARIRRVAGSESTLEWWGPGSSDSRAGASFGISTGDLGVAFGVGTLGEAGDASLPGRLISTPQFSATLGAESGAITDFIVGDASRVVPISVATAWALSGAPAALVELNGPSGCALLDALDGLYAAIEPSAAVLGFIVLAQTQGHQPGLFAVGIAFDPETARTRADSYRQLEAMPDQIALPSGRRLAGGAITLQARPAIDGASDLAGALRSAATLATLGGLVALTECAPATNAVVWVYAPTEIRSGAAKLLQVNVEGGGEWRPEWDGIVRHLYADCRSVTLTTLPGGFMSSTFKAVAYDQDGRRTLPSVVKIGPADVTRREVEANRHYISRFILNNGTTLLGDAEHGEWAGLRYNFLGVNGPDSRLTWLYDQYLHRPLPDVLSLFEQLFTRVLKPWYAQPKWEQVFLFRDHSPLRLFPELLAAAESTLGLSAESPEFECRELGARLPNPFYFLKHEYPRHAGESRLWYTSVCHGDLNLRNVLVDERDNLYVIDFSETRPRNVVSDFARLEPVLKFEMTRPESDDDLHHLVVFEEALMSVTALDQPPPFRYDGGDPMVARAHAGITLLRRYADRATLFETDLVPYWLAMLEWTYPAVCYRQLTLRQKRYAACSAALICRSILQLEGRA